MMDWRKALLLSLSIAAVVPALAHDGRPIYIEVIELESNTWQLASKVPDTIKAHQRPHVRLTKPCITKTNQLYRCETRDLTLQISTGGPASPRPLLVRWQPIGASAQYLNFAPGTQSARLQSTPTVQFFAYARLGLQHILSGYDHLLFVACLTFIARGRKRLILAITGFTLAHSITLGVSVAGSVQLPMPPMEASIALSLLLLAVELLRGEKSASLTWRYPIVVAVAFGLLHGFGFASALTDVGLPNNEVLHALLAFNLGVEIGQLLFVGLMLVLLWVFKNQRRLQTLTGYVAGSLATLWLLQRLANF